MGNIWTSEPDPEEVLKELNNFPLHLWSTKEVVSWLKAILGPTANANLIRLVEEYKIDGDGLLELGIKFFEHHKEVLGMKSENWEHFSEIVVEKLEPFVQRLNEDKQLINSIEAKESKKFEPYTDCPKDANQLVLYYHRKTWNHEKGAARSLGRNWINQPFVHRRWYGAPCTQLDFPRSRTPLYNSLFASEIDPQEISLQTLSHFFYYSLSCTSSKDSTSIAMYPKSCWSKRCNASSGGLHPVETHVFVPTSLANSKGLPEFYHYSPKEHTLELRGKINYKMAPFLNQWENPEFILIGLSSLNWREIWKYGERAYRYCLLDIGHALGSIAVSALTLGWRILLLNSNQNISDDTFSTFFNLTTVKEPTEIEYPGILMMVYPASQKISGEFANSLVAEIEKIAEYIKNESKETDWLGKPQQVSFNYYHWDIIDLVMKATKIEKNKENINFKIPDKKKNQLPETTNTWFESSNASASGKVIRYRRSALDFYDYSFTFKNIEPPPKLTKNQFFAMVSRLVPNNNDLYWSMVHSLGINIGTAIYVVDVEGLASGYYILFRSEKQRDYLKKHMKENDFVWTKPTEELDLYLIKQKPYEEMKNLSHQYSCGQSIALHCAFHISMFAPIKELIDTNGPSIYRYLHWESGYIGALLYLEAISHKHGATGMGCYLDDISLKEFGFFNTDDEQIDYEPMQPLYHFTVGVDTGDNRYPFYNYEKDMIDILKGDLDNK